MRSVSPAIEDRAALDAYVEDCATRSNGRLGVLVGYPTGPAYADFDVVVSRQADRPYASASIIKLIVLRALYGRYGPSLDALDERRTISEQNRVGGAGVLHLFDSPEPTLRDLARAMIVISDNAATNELIDHLGMRAINETAADLGMTDTRLGRKMMTTLEPDDDTDGDAVDAPVNTTSPRDCATFFAALCHGRSQSEVARAEQRGMLRNQKDESMFSRYFPYECTVAHKTGWLPDAALDTGLVEADAERPLFFAAFCDRAENGGDATDIVAAVGAAVLEWSGFGA